MFWNMFWNNGLDEETNDYYPVPAKSWQLAEDFMTSPFSEVEGLLHSSALKGEPRASSFLVDSPVKCSFQRKLMKLNHCNRILLWVRWLTTWLTRNQLWMYYSCGNACTEVYKQNSAWRKVLFSENSERKFPHLNFQNLVSVKRGKFFC